jgi:hypothetical protein
VHQRGQEKHLELLDPREDVAELRALLLEKRLDLLDGPESMLADGEAMRRVARQESHHLGELRHNHLQHAEIGHCTQGRRRAGLGQKLDKPRSRLRRGPVLPPGLADQVARGAIEAQPE